MDDSTPSALLLHDGELTDVGALMGRMQLRVVDRRGAPNFRDRKTDWLIVVGTPSRIVELGPMESGPPRVAIHEGDARTARSMLSRLGVQMQVRRPFHPEALRLLILHQIYHGPEKRRSVRVAVGAEVRFKVGLRKRPAVLADLSVRGCRLLTSQVLERGAGIRLWLPAELAPDAKALALRGKVVRSLAPIEGREGSMGVAFEVGSREQGARLSAVVTAFAAGPARLSASESARQVGGASDPPERRTEPRRAYPNRVVALDEASTRVLAGKDISRGGMRVDPNPSLSLGDHLKIAIHVRARSEPLVVWTRVVRDDGPRGLVLQFHKLAPEAEQYLDKMVHLLPILSARDDDGDGALVMSEILDRRAG